MRNKVAIIGLGGFGFDHTDHIQKIKLAMAGHRRTVVIVENPNVLTISGQKYERIEEKHPGRLSLPSLIGSFGGYSRPRPRVHIETEFELVQQKKSKLCKSDRDWVVGQFFKMYKKI